MPFQAAVNITPGLGVAGDFASSNPRASVVVGEGALMAGTNGVTIGNFAWATNGNVASAGTGVPTGFVGRENNAFIAQIGQEGSMVIPAGRMATLYSAGDFLAVTKTTATVGQKVFANLTDGSISTGAAGATGAVAVGGVPADEP